MRSTLNSVASPVSVGNPTVIVRVGNSCGSEQGATFVANKYEEFFHDSFQSLRRQFGQSPMNPTNDEVVSYSRVSFRDGPREALFLFDYMRPDITGEVRRYFKVWESLRARLEGENALGALPWTEPSLFARAPNRRSEADRFRLLRVEYKHGGSFFLGPLPAWPFKLNAVPSLERNHSLFHGVRTVFEAVATDESGNTHSLYFSDKRVYETDFAPRFDASDMQVRMVTGSAEAEELFGSLSPFTDPDGFEHFHSVWSRLVECDVL